MVLEELDNGGMFEPSVVDIYGTEILLIRLDRMASSEVTFDYNTRLLDATFRGMVCGGREGICKTKRDRRCVAEAGGSGRL